MRIDGLPTTNPVPGSQIRVVQGRAGFRPEPSPAPELTNQEQLSSEAKLLRELATRDREVRAHEAAHAIAGGQYASSPRFSYQIGPNGRSYAVGGKVQIDTAPIAGDPEKTLEKAQTIRRAALAPASPSPQDMAIAAKAAQMALMARAEISIEEGREASRERAEQQETGITSTREAATIYQQIQDEV